LVRGRTGDAPISRQSDVTAPSSARLDGLSVRAARVPYEFVCFPLVAAVFAAHLFTSGYDRFYYDSSLYWELGKTFEHDGHFSLLAYSGATFHGYSMPLVTHVLQVIASAFGLGAVTIVKLFGSLLAATLGVLVLPRLARRLFSNAAVGIPQVLALNACCSSSGATTSTFRSPTSLRYCSGAWPCSGCCAATRLASSRRASASDWRRTCAPRIFPRSSSRSRSRP
jgi:hypothetical protein